MPAPLPTIKPTKNIYIYQMRPSHTEMIFSQVMFFTMTALFAYIAYLFHIMKGNGTRKIFMSLFIALAFNFGLDGLYWLLWDVGVFDSIQPIAIRLIRNVPLTVISVWMGLYIKKK